MSNKIAILIFIIFSIAALHSQNKIIIPDTLSGSVINLSISNGEKEFLKGKKATTIGYNGNYLGKTIILEKGQNVKFNVHNLLDEATSTHWHGLHVATINDGSPHNPIMPSAVWSPEFTVLDNAATYWYHPHLHGKTLKQVVKGAAGMIIVRDDEERALNLPRRYGIDDFPLVLQFLTLNDAGNIVDDDELDNTILVNGAINGQLDCPAEWVRLRLLNGSSHRVFNLGFDNNFTFYQIAGDAGLLQKPVPLTRLMLGSGERAEIILNLSNKEGETLNINQLGNELPVGFPGGPPMGMMGNIMLGPLDNKKLPFMTIKVLKGNNFNKALPSKLIDSEALPPSSFNRSFSITAQPMMSMTNFFINNQQFDMEEVNFKTKLGITESWTITNQTMMAHPFHVHGNHFFITQINGQAPPENIKGRKDVVIIPPMNGSVKLVTTFSDFSDTDMPYMYHCHILSHEDKGMMGQFIVTDETSGVENENNILKVNIKPNPASTFIKIEYPLSSNNDLQVAIYDIQGKLFFKKSHNFNQNLNLIVDISSLPVGPYYLKTTDVLNIEIAKFFKK